MAIGFKPKAEMTLSLPGCSPSEILLVAAEAARQLGWRAGGMTRTEAVFYTPMSMRSWEEKVTLREINGQVVATSACSTIQIIDWGKNKSNLKKLFKTMQRLHDSHCITNDKESVHPYIAYTSEQKEAVQAHIRKYFGSINAILRSEETNSPVEILLVAPTNRYDYYTLVTCGAGASSMKMPHKDLPSRCEFCISLPPEWNPESNEPEDRWPVEWLFRCAELTRQKDIWLTCGHTVSDGSPLHENTAMESLLLLSPEKRDEQAGECTLPDGEKVAFYELYPLYKEETEFKQANGLANLLDKLKDCSHIARTDRRNTCEGYSAFHSAENDGVILDDSNRMTFRSILTPRKGNMATPILVYINVSIFLLMVLCGVNFLFPTGISILKWGADFGPLTLSGEWWRTFTCNFIHIGVIHLLMNMYALLYIGAYLEQLVGTDRLSVAYVLTGLCSASASLMIHPDSISAGASGAIFGLYGIFLSYLLFHRIERHQRRSLLYSIGFFVVYNLLTGARTEGIDNAAHVGGLVSGLLLGAGYVQADRMQTDSRAISRIAEGVLLVLFILAFTEQTRLAPSEYEEIQAAWKSGELEKYATEETDGEETANSDTPILSPPTTTDPDKWETYTVDQLGFSCSYPAHWMTQKSNEQCILYLLDEQNSIAINHNKFDTEEELDEMHRTILHSMQGEPVEKINVQGKEFEKISVPMDYPVAGGGTIHVQQTLVFRLDRETLEGYLIICLTTDDSHEAEAQKLIESVQLKS